MPDRVFNRKESILFASGVGAFVALFLLLFRPYGLLLNGWRDPAFWLIVGLAPYNMILVLLLDGLFTQLRSRWTWAHSKWVSVTGTVSVIIFANVGYQLFLQSEVSWHEVVTSFWQVALIAFFPTLFVILYNNRKTNQSIPQNTKNELLNLHDEAHRETLMIHEYEILCVASDRNYVLVHTTQQDQPHLLRNSLKNIEQQLTNTSIVRCHRSYLVNTIHIISRRKYARGFHLTLRNTKTSIPVSASYMKAFEQYVEG